MTVSELIAKLKDCAPNAEVNLFVLTACYECESALDFVETVDSNGEEVTIRGPKR